MVKISICVLLGYLVGSLNPAALIGKLKKQNLRNRGTGNLGATNALLLFGKRMGAFVMLVDIFKSFFIVKFAAWLAPNAPWIVMCIGFFVILGHCFPFYMHFRGGRGTAAFGGLVLAYSPLLFLFLLISGMIFMIIVNHGVALPFYAVIVFAVFVLATEQSPALIAFAILSAALVIERNLGGLKKAIQKEDAPVRDYIKAKLFRSGKDE